MTEEATVQEERSPKELTNEKADWSKHEAFNLMKQDRDACCRKLSRLAKSSAALSIAGEKAVAALHGTEEGTLSDTVFAIRHYDAIAEELEKALAQYYREVTA